VEFIVALNPDADSKLPFLLFLPLGSGLWLKAKESWPRTARVYCHPADSPKKIADLDVLERVPVLVCERRGAAIDLVLARGTNKRSQFVFTKFRGTSDDFMADAEGRKRGTTGCPNSVHSNFGACDHRDRHARTVRIRLSVA
jgi:hypothetical protein